MARMRYAARLPNAPACPPAFPSAPFLAFFTPRTTRAMNLKTTYLGLNLRNPVVVGASPFCDNLTACRELVDAGAAAIVMHSFFEEQIEAPPRSLTPSHALLSEDGEAVSPFPHYEDYRLDPDQYVRQLARLRKLVDVPIVGSLNGSRKGNWIGYVQQMEDAGAAAIELNPYQLPTDPSVPADEVEANMVELVKAVASAVKIPVAVKLSPYHTSMANIALVLADSGAAGVVLFNRFYQPDVDVDLMKVVSQLRLSRSSDLLLRLRWLSLLSPHFPGSLACSGGVHTSEDLVKALLAGADVVQVVSALLKYGPKHVATLLQGLETWMREHEFTAISRFRGALNLRQCADPASHERAHYLHVLQSWQV